MSGLCKIVVAGVGGQGSLTMTRLLGEAALLAGLEATAGEIHGMSQRGGVVVSTLVIGAARSPLVGRGCADVLVGFEPLEALRAVDRVGPQTTLLVNTRPIVPFGLTLADREYPDALSRLRQLEGSVARLVTFDVLRLAEEAGSSMAVNSVLSGALAELGVLPLPGDALRDYVVSSVVERLREVNARAFEAGRRFINNLG
ncbi:MAG: indolepyruvate oxidoreductase subunit beta [Candidatus Alcyoniella australis]|nr:indolepyruvate oxidoreductase subunit beta [Candidatus Alcyoniella australis]